MPHSAPVPRTVTQITWPVWTPDDRATLVFVIQDGQILLIEKKRGLGAGKVNGPGGRLEPNETAIQCAAREVEEELRVVPHGLTQRGDLSFQFTDGYALHCAVFRASSIMGTATETDEAVPLWTPLDAIPYARMWQDDAMWLPVLIAGGTFSGRFVFEGDVMLDYVLDLG
jgi:8-oxo-dGTP diphosphatase